MDAIKILSIATAVCIFASAGFTYYFMDDVKQTEINNLKNYYGCEIGNLNSLITYYENELNRINNQLSNLKENLEQTNLSLQENISELEKLQSGNKYELHDPTYNEVANFIASDTTDEIPYDSETFDCEHFSQLVNNNSENQGMRCAYVILYFYDTNTGHAIVGFNTVDRGMVYVEPQSDEWVENLEVGNDYWTDCVVPNDDYYYEDAPNDTIKEILIFW
jgi:hypothetical protein